MSTAAYQAARAAADLRDAGLLAGTLVEQDGVLAAGEPGDAGGAFHGAGLDSRSLAPDQLFVALVGEHSDGRNHAPAALTEGHWILTRAVDDGTGDPLAGSAAAPGTGVLLSHDPVAALGHLARSWRESLGPRVVAVTGTNGKTTTKDLLSAVLSGAGAVHATRGNFNNHLGVPLTLLALAPEHRFAVIELGASALGEIATLAGLARPQVGVITNASEAHLAEFGNLKGVIAGKGELVEALPATGTAVLNADSPGFAAWRERTSARVVSFGTGGDHPWTWHGVGSGGVLVLDREEWPVPLPGEHNGANLAAAVLAARALGVRDDALRRGLASFRGSPHRGVLSELSGRTFLDDTYNANPRSVVAATRALLAMPGSGSAVAVLGAMAELGPDSDDIHRATGSELAGAGLDRLVTVGTAAQPFGEGFAAAGGQAAHCDDHAGAAVWLAAHTRPGDHVLVKGSRSTAMEAVLEIFAAAGGTA